MTYYLGRLLDHVHLRVADLDASRRFYRAALDALGLLTVYSEGDGWFQADELFVDMSPGPRSNVHLAFQAHSREQVESFHALTIAAGGTDNGGPGLRRYHSSYFAAYVLDPDGNNVEAVCHGPAKRSCASIAVDVPRPDSGA
jgi:catechol 2,3-dioxygenase-like lactoylglutathione lyase family enzyme